MNDSIFGEVIHAYTRAQAIEDGELVDVSTTAREAGIRYPVAVSRAVWVTYIDREEMPGQDTQGRLWDTLWMFRVAATKGEGSILTFRLYFAMPDAGDWQPNEASPEAGSSLTRDTHRLVTLKAICGPGDTAAPVITILMPNED